MRQLVREDTRRKGLHIETGADNNLAVDPRRITATTIIGDKVKSRAGEELGKIEEVTLDLTSGTVTYVVLSVGGFLGIGDRFFAIPLDALTFNIKERSFYLDVDKKTLRRSHGFDKNDWPSTPRWPLDGTGEDDGMNKSARPPSRGRQGKS